MVLASSPTVKLPKRIRRALIKQAHGRVKVYTKFLDELCVYSADDMDTDHGAEMMADLYAQIAEIGEAHSECLASFMRSVAS